MTVHPNAIIQEKKVQNEWCIHSAKKTRFTRDIEIALKLLESSLGNTENPDSAAKDIANLLHVLGKADEAVQYLQANQAVWRFKKVHSGLLLQLRSLVGKPVSPIASRVVFVEIPTCMGRISLDSLRRLFPNIAKVWRIILSRSNQSCLLEFASHSSARRAVDARQQSISPNASPVNSASMDSVKCAWVSPYVDIPAFSLSSVNEFPIIEITDDESIICPSTDWRRPRPTNTCGQRSNEGFSVNDLLSVLRMAGAFDDYPPELSQIHI